MDNARFFKILKNVILKSVLLREREREREREIDLKRKKHFRKDESTTAIRSTRLNLNCRCVSRKLWATEARARCWNIQEIYALRRARLRYYYP